MNDDDDAAMLAKASSTTEASDKDETLIIHQSLCQVQRTDEFDQGQRMHD